MSTRRSRVLHLVTRYRQGGSEQRVRDLVAALPDVDHTVVVGAGSDAHLAREQLGQPVEVMSHLVRSPHPYRDARAIVAVRSRLRRDDIDVLITHQSKAGFVGRIAARSSGRSRRVPVVHSLSMSSFGPGYGRMESVVFRNVERVLGPLTARYVVVGADLARRFEVAGIASDSLTIVRSGAPLPAPRTGAPTSVSGVPDGRPVIVSLGALEDRKNPLDLVPLVQRVKASVPDVFLAVAGDGPLRTDLEAAVRAAGLERDVALLGYVKPVESLLWRADALVLLSNAEGLPQVLIQAGAAGVPFVTYDVDGAREVVGLGAVGEVVELGDVVGAADAVTRMLTKHTAGTRTVNVSSWNPEVIQQSYRAVVDNVLEARRRAS